MCSGGTGEIGLVLNIDIGTGAPACESGGGRGERGVQSP